MTKPIPEATTISNPDDTIFVTDSKGRKIEYKKLGLKDKSRLMMVVGGDNSANQVFFGHAAIAVGVRSIDDVPFNRPTNLEQVFNALDRLEDHGLEAIAEEIAKRMEAEGEGEGDVWETAKN